jgi:hypothetical protein
MGLVTVSSNIVVLYCGQLELNQTNSRCGSWNSMKKPSVADRRRIVSAAGDCDLQLSERSIARI